jgi:hypothetical protein
MLSPEQVARFQRTGLLVLPQTVPADQVAAISDAVWTFLGTRHDRHRDRPETWSPLTGRAGLQSVSRSGTFDAVGQHLSPPVDDLLGPGGWKVPRHWGHALITFPTPEPWQISAVGWHVDSHRWAPGAVPGVVAFTFVEKVRPRGGGTLVVSGSCHLNWRLCHRSGGFVPTSELKLTLARAHPWFARLWAGPVRDPGQIREYLEAEVVVDGIDVTVVELCGDPGDVVLMNPRCLHAPAPNTSVAPRLMLSDFLDRIRPAAPAGVNDGPTYCE